VRVLKSFSIHIRDTLAGTQVNSATEANSTDNVFLVLRRLLTLACSPHQGLSELSVCRPFLHSTLCNQSTHPGPLRGWKSLGDRALGHLSPQDKRNQSDIWDSPSHLEDKMKMKTRLWGYIFYIRISVIFEGIKWSFDRFFHHFLYSWLTSQALHGLDFFPFALLDIHLLQFLIHTFWLLIGIKQYSYVNVIAKLCSDKLLSHHISLGELLKNYSIFI